MTPPQQATYSDYIHTPIPGSRDTDISANLNLNRQEQISLTLAINDALRRYEEQGFVIADAQPTSHIATLASLKARMHMMQHGINRWNLR